MADFTILALDGAFASGVSAAVDILTTAATVAARMGVAVPTWRLCSVTGGTVSLQNGFRIDTTSLPEPGAADRSLWIIPGLATDTPSRVDKRLQQPDAQAAVARIAAHVAAGGEVAAVCSAVFLLAAAGVLPSRRVTTTWWLAAHLQHCAPQARIDSDRMVCTDGPVITGGAAFAQVDLMIHVLRQRGGAELAERVSRVLLIDGREAQADYIIPEMLAGGDALASRLVARVESALPDCPSVAALASEFAMSERTLARHVRAATGRSPLALIQSVRLRRARKLLEGSRLTVDQVAEAVGYQDATALRRLMKKGYQESPAGLR
ncbi:MAG: helix-turn-helix domain-containing protein [Fluviicoccus sp.]|uniref:GlxA family transcriptional regulator n=1 Tax=Fluviicoccus sp. TaxID=2003552 RepID=UPI00271D2555|nr:helix-turn-helix domain-containing protein [Fluviicoccus sp.]MDO8332177.1 helix-turn-helix domain-containing protein [Fluviicoccus sp.]